MPHETFLQKFRDTFLIVNSDIDGFMELVDKDCTWTLEATGEAFKGYDKVKELAERFAAGRSHTEDNAMEVKNLFVTDDYMVIEYIHNAVVTDKWPSSTNRPAPGTRLSLPICIVAHFKGEKLDWLHEYFDLASASGRQGKFFS